MTQNLQEVAGTLQDQLNILVDALRGIKLRDEDVLGVCAGVGQSFMWQLQVTGETFMRLRLHVTHFVTVHCERGTSYLRLANALSPAVEIFALVELDNLHVQDRE
jgi:phage shock protein PspC (stress-responsive transcriptional regulator)